MNRWTGPVNVTLSTLLVIATTSGVLAFSAGAEPGSGVVVAVHGGAGLGLLLLAPAKTAIARRGLRRPGRPRKAVSSAFTALVLLAVGSGLLHAVGGFAPFVGLLPMQIHVGSAVGVVVLLVAHVLAHHLRRMRWRPLLPRTGPGRTDLDRRIALRGALLVVGAAALWTGALWTVAPGRERRFPAAGADALLLATHAAGRPLSVGHGGPARLVAPGRRGFWWVKRVVAIEVVEEPWWWQPPFPLQ